MERDLSLHETKDGIQDTQINEINDEIDALKDSMILPIQRFLVLMTI